MHRCNCHYCPRQGAASLKERVAFWVIAGTLAYWKLFLLVRWIGKLVS